MDPQFPAPAAAGDLLAGLVPALVHRLNNTLAVLSGALDPDADPGERVRAKEEIRRAARALSHLSGLAKPCARGAREEYDLRTALDAVELLVGPLAASRRLVLEVARCASPLPARVDGRRFERFLVEFVAAEVLAAVNACEGARAGQDGPRRQRSLRIGGAIRPGRAMLTVTRALGSELGPPAVLRRERAFLLEQGIDVLQRRLGGALAYRIGVESPALETRRTETLHRASARLLVLESDPALRELVEAVLLEAGHELVPAQLSSPASIRDALATEPDLALVDADLEDLLRGLTEQRPGAPLLLLGHPRAPLPAASPSLSKPFRPGDLLQAVDACLASRCTQAAT